MHSDGPSTGGRNNRALKPFGAVSLVIEPAGFGQTTISLWRDQDRDDLTVTQKLLASGDRKIEAAISKEEADTIEDLVRRAVVPTLPHKTLQGLDGVKLRMSIATGTSTSSYSWRAEPPEEWAALGEVASALTQLARRHWPDLRFSAD